MKITKIDAKNQPTTVDELNVGDVFDYEGNVYIKIAPRGGKELRNDQGSVGFNAVKLNDGFAFIFRDKHGVKKVRDSEYTYTL